MKSADRHQNYLESDREIRSRYSWGRRVGATSWALALFGVALPVAAALAAHPQFLVLSFGFTGFVVILVAFTSRQEAALTGLKFTIQVGGDRVAVGGYIKGRLVVVNSGTKRSFPFRAEMPVGTDKIEWTLPALKCGEEHDAEFRIEAKRRGTMRVGPVSARGRHRIGLSRDVHCGAGEILISVHPEIVAPTRYQPSMTEILDHNSLRSSDLDLAGVKPYSEGDPVRHVHWRSSVRTGGLVVKHFAAAPRSRFLMVLFSDAPSFGSPEEFELAVSLLASMGYKAIADHTDGDIVWGQAHFAPRAPGAFLDAMAKIEPIPQEQAELRILIRRSLTKRLAPTLALLVVGSGTPVESIQLAGRAFGVGTVVIALRVELGATPTVVRLAQMRVATVGSLADLPIAINGIVR